MSKLTCVNNNKIYLRRSIPSSWIEPVEFWLAWLKLGGRTGETIKQRQFQVNRLARDFPSGPGSVNRRDLSFWLTAHDWSPATLRSHVTMARTFFHWAKREGYVDKNPAKGLPSQVPQTYLPRPAPLDAVAKRCNALIPTRD